MTAPILAALLLSVATVAVGSLTGASPYLTGTLVVVYALAPFFVGFERRKPQAREIVVLATLVALAVVARVAFAAIPHFKPMAAVIMITGIAFGARTGFLVGASAALISNFLFGQGPWTPWQMLAFGVAGLVAGVVADGLANRGRLARDAAGGERPALGHRARGRGGRSGLTWPQRVALAVGGFLLVVCVVGPLLDTCTLFMMVSRITLATAAAIYLAGLPVNIMHGAATFLTLLLVANPLLGILNRVRVKYGLLS